MDRYPGRSAVVLVALGAVMLAGVERFDVDPITQPRPAETCLSPWMPSDVYRDPGANFMTPYLGERSGVEAHINIPKDSDAMGIEAGFDDPTTSAVGWQSSDMIPVQPGEQVRLRMAIGKGAVEFGIRYVAPDGSDTCDEVPLAGFVELGPDDFALLPGMSPWPNPGEALYKAGVPVPAS